MGSCNSTFGIDFTFKLSINSGSIDNQESKALDSESTSTPAAETPAEDIPLIEESSEESE